MMIDRLAGNAALKDSIRLMLGSSRLTHSVLLVGETGLGAGYAARCVAADYLYPAGGAPAEALLRGECCRAVGKAGDRDSGRIETGVVREAISVTGMGSGGRYLVSQVKAMRTEIFNTSLSAEGRAVLLYHVERMNEESANALLKVMEEPPEGVLFLLTADSLAGVLPTIRSRCVSFAVAPVSPEECAQWCIGQGVDKKQARLYSELFDGHIGTVLAAARDDARREQVEKALTLAKAAAAHDSYAAAVLLAGYEKDKAAAAALGICYVDTGAIYRTIGYGVYRRGIDPSDAGAVAAVLPDMQLEMRYDQAGLQRMMLAGEDVTDQIRLPEMSRYASTVSAIPAVRDFLLELQREQARRHSVIMDGRDIGTVVLPDATVKIFLTATPEARATRRWKEYQAKGIDTPYEEVLADVKQRDYQDTHRVAAPLKQADDAVLLDTSELDFEQSLAAMKKIIAEKVNKTIK